MEVLPKLLPPGHTRGRGCTGGGGSSNGATRSQPTAPGRPAQQEGQGWDHSLALGRLQAPDLGGQMGGDPFGFGCHHRYSMLAQEEEVVVAMACPLPPIWCCQLKHPEATLPTHPRHGALLASDGATASAAGP